MISAIKRKVLPACSDSNCFNARVSTKSLHAAEKLNPFFWGGGLRGERRLGGKKNFYGKGSLLLLSYVLCFSAKLDRRLGGLSGPPRSPLLLCWATRKRGSVSTLLPTPQKWKSFNYGFKGCATENTGAWMRCILRPLDLKTDAVNSYKQKASQIWLKGNARIWL